MYLFVIQDSITQAQFCDMLIGLGVERTEAIKVMCHTLIQLLGKIGKQFFKYLK